MKCMRMQQYLFCTVGCCRARCSFFPVYAWHVFKLSQARESEWGKHTQNPPRIISCTRYTLDRNCTANEIQRVYILWFIHRLPSARCSTFCENRMSYIFQWSGISFKFILLLFLIYCKPNHLFICDKIQLSFIQSNAFEHIHT